MPDYLSAVNIPVEAILSLYLVASAIALVFMFRFSRAIIDTMRKPDGKYSVGTAFAWIGTASLTFGFYKEALTNGLIWQDYIAYAVALTIMYAPHKAIELIKAIKGEEGSSSNAPVTANGAI